jgi:hypothetical protein
VDLRQRAQIGAMSSPRPSWRPLLAGTVGLFLVILAFLAGQVRAGGDPALGRGNAATQQATEQRTPQQIDPPQGANPSVPGFGGGQDPSADDGFIPGGSAPAPPVPDASGGQGGPSSDAPATHQS